MVRCTRSESAQRRNEPGRDSGMTLGFAAPVLHAQWAPDGVRVPGLNGW